MHVYKHLLIATKQYQPNYIALIILFILQLSILPALWLLLVFLLLSLLLFYNTIIMIQTGGKCLNG